MTIPSPEDDDDEPQAEMLESLDVDAGQLDGLKPAACYTYGYELGRITTRANIERGAWQCYVRVENVERVRKALAYRKREFVLKPTANDISESWWWLEVAASTTVADNPYAEVSSERVSQERVRFKQMMPQDWDFTVDITGQFLQTPVLQAWRAWCAAVGLNYEADLQ